MNDVEKLLQLNREGKLSDDNLASLLNSLAESQKETKVEKTDREKLAEANRARTAELRKKFEAAREAQGKADAEFQREFNLELMLEYLEGVRNANGERVFKDEYLKSLAGFEIENVYNKAKEVYEKKEANVSEAESDLDKAEEEVEDAKEKMENGPFAPSPFTVDPKNKTVNMNANGDIDFSQLNRDMLDSDNSKFEDAEKNPDAKFEDAQEYKVLPDGKTVVPVTGPDNEDPSIYGSMDDTQAKDVIDPIPTDMTGSDPQSEDENENVEEPQSFHVKMIQQAKDLGARARDKIKAFFMNEKTGNVKVGAVIGAAAAVLLIATLGPAAVSMISQAIMNAPQLAGLYAGAKLGK